MTRNNLIFLHDPQKTRKAGFPFLTLAVKSPWSLPPRGIEISGFGEGGLSTDTRKPRYHYLLPETARTMFAAMARIYFKNPGNEDGRLAYTLKQGQLSLSIENINLDDPDAVLEHLNNIMEGLLRLPK